eukprot:Hpha_TRINITY_DN16975_c1_g1::TRINITY_DN16975_c1_g1_i1::g.54376::m.54376
MRRVAVAVVAAALYGTVHADQPSLTAEYVESNIEGLWASFKASHRKSYASIEEERLRKGHFHRNMHKAASAQKANPLATFGVTRFSDFSDEEWASFRGGLTPRTEETMRPLPAEEVQAKLKRAETIIDRDLDWNKNAHVITAVQNQGNCGGCWAFAAVGAIEGAWARSLNPLTKLSEQFLISCARGSGVPYPDSKMPSSWSAGDCGGGNPESAFHYLLDATDGQIVSEDAYPYVESKWQSGLPTASCSYTSAMPWVAQINGAASIPNAGANTENVILAALEQHGPVAVGINSNPIQMYVSGVVTDCPVTQPDHGVLVVGYGHEVGTGTRYWTIKNSWGSSFGEGGYFRIQFGKNLCNINSMASYPLVQMPAPVPGTIEVPIAQPDPVPAVAPAAERLPFVPPADFGPIPNSPQEEQTHEEEVCVSGADCSCKAKWLSWMGLEGKKVGNVCASMLILAGCSILVCTLFGVCVARACCGETSVVYRRVPTTGSPVPSRSGSPPPRSSPTAAAYQVRHVQTTVVTQAPARQAQAVPLVE